MQAQEGAPVLSPVHNVDRPFFRPFGEVSVEGKRGMMQVVYLTELSPGRILAAALWVNGRRQTMFLAAAWLSLALVCLPGLFYYNTEGTRAIGGAMLHQQMVELQIPHRYLFEPHIPHRWDSGWIPKAVEFLVQD